MKSTPGLCPEPIHKLVLPGIEPATFRGRQRAQPSTGYDPVRKGGSPQDLGVGVVLHLVLVGLLGVEAEALAGARATGATGPLLSRGLADGRDQQRLHTDTRVVHLQPSLHIEY